MLQVKNLSKTFKSHRSYQKALDDINVSFPEKGMVFIIGKSGSGKSTLLNMMAGLASPDKGEVLFNGRNVTKMKEKDLDSYHYQDIAFIFQNYCIMEELSVEENVALGKEENPRNIKDEIEDVLNKVGLLQQRKKKAKYLSGGEKQRVAIARAIVKKPSIIFSDEPTGNLDKQSSKDVLSILKEYSKEGLVIIVSHNLFDAYEYGDRIITLDQGKIIEDKSLSHDKQDPSSVYIDSTSFIDKGFINQLNENLKEKKVTRLLSQDSAFKETDEKQFSSEEKKEGKKLKRSFFKPYSSIFKAIGQNWFRVTFFSVITSLLLVLFYNLFSVSNAKNYDLALNESEYYKKTDNLTVFKKYNDPTENYRDKTQPIAESKDDLQDTEGLYQDAFKLYRFQHMYYKNSLVSDYESYQVFNDKTTLYYPKKNNGLLICNDEYIKKNLQIDKIEYIKKANNIKKSGIYMTDFMADAYISNSEGLFKTYDDLVGYVGYKSYNKNYSNAKAMYVNAIIKTDYRNKYPELFNLLSSKQDSIYIKENQYQEGVDYITNALAIFYSTNKDFFIDAKQEKIKDRFVFPVNYVAENSNEQTENVTGVILGRCSSLKDNECIISPMFAKNINCADEGVYTDSNPLSLRKRINKNEFSSPLKFTKVYLSSAHRELYQEEDTPFNEAALWVSDDLFNKLFVEDGIPVGYHFYKVNDKDALMAHLSEKDYRLTIANQYFTEQFYTYLFVFTKAFRLISFICLAVAVFALFLYSYNLIKLNNYNIGIFKALGYNGGKLSLYFLARFSLFTLMTAAYYFIFDLIFLYCANTILSKTIRRLSGMTPFYYHRIFTFVMKDFLLGVACLLLFICIVDFFYLFLLRKKKVDTILRNKD